MDDQHSIFLIRHAKAGSRSTWDGDDDELRPLTPKGNRQAEELAARLHDRITAVRSSPYLRCVQTVTPLAVRVGAEVETVPMLAEGGYWPSVLEYLEATTTSLAICTHGDVLGDVLRAIERRGVPIIGFGVEKACAWELTVIAHEIRAAHHHPAPEV
jgi:8-oxo-dGTP diphosphatase